MQFVKLEGMKMTVYKNAEFPYKDSWQFMLDDGACYGTPVNKNWRIHCPSHSIKGSGNALIQRFECCYKECNCELYGDQNAHYIFRKGKESLTDKDIKKILSIVCKLGIGFQLEVVE